MLEGPNLRLAPIERRSDGIRLDDRELMPIPSGPGSNGTRTAPWTNRCPAHIERTHVYGVGTSTSLDPGEGRSAPSEFLQYMPELASTLPKPVHVGEPVPES